MAYSCLTILFDCYVKHVWDVCVCVFVYLFIYFLLYKSLLGMCFL